jgi:acyl-coenzyme A synthetase/AMP-(fatty) acid ligase
MLKVSSVWISPIEIGRVLSGHPAVQEVAVVFRQDADELPKPLAFLALRDGGSGSPQLAHELQEFVLDRLRRREKFQLSRRSDFRFFGAAKGS